MNTVLRVCLLTLVFLDPAVSYCQSSWPTVSKRASELRDGWAVKGEAQKAVARQEFVAAVEGQKSESLKRLDRDSLKLSADLDRLHERMVAIRDALRTTGKVLKVPGQLNQKLAQLETSLTTADNALLVAETPPQTRAKAQKLRSQIKDAVTKVKSAHATVAAIAQKTDPLSEKLLKAEARLGQADLVLIAFNTVALKPEPVATTVAQECIAGGAADRRDCMQRTVDAKADELDRIAVEFDRVVLLLLTDLDVIARDILPVLPAINADMKFLEDFMNSLGPLITNLDKLVEPLRELDALLDKSFSTCVSVPLLGEGCTPRISMRVIVNGVDDVMNEIEKRVGGAVLEILKVFGLEAVAKKIVNLGSEPLDAVLRTLHLDFQVDLGPIDRVIGLADQLLPALGRIDIDFDAKVPALDANVPAFGLPGFDPGLDVKAFSLPWFNPNGLTLSDMPLVPCSQASYFCAN